MEKGVNLHTTHNTHFSCNMVLVYGMTQSQRDAGDSGKRDEVFMTPKVFTSCSSIACSALALRVSDTGQGWHFAFDHVLNTPAGKANSTPAREGKLPSEWQKSCLLYVPFSTPEGKEIPLGNNISTAREGLALGDGGAAG
jgi:hypothetical protein